MTGTTSRIALVPVLGGGWKRPDCECQVRIEEGARRTVVSLLPCEAHSPKEG